MKAALPAALLGCGLLGGCPIFPPPPTCADGGSCPPGLVCCTDDYCRAPGAIVGCGGTTGRPVKSSSSGSGGTTGTSTSGGSSGGSTSGAGGTGGGSTGGSPFLMACPVPSGAAWPTKCGSPIEVMDLPDASINDVSIVGLGDGGFLVGVVDDNFGYAQFATVEAGGGHADAGYVDCALTACPNTSLSFVPGAAGKPPTLVAGYYPPGPTLTFVDEMACWAPFSTGAPTSVIADPDQSGSFDLVRAAASHGDIGVAVTDFNWCLAYLAFGDGGCPVAVEAEGSGNSGALAATGLPGSSAFLSASSASGARFDEVGLWLEPEHHLLEQLPYGAAAATCPNDVGSAPYPIVGAASDGVTAVAVTGDPVVGVQLFSATLDGGPILDGGVVALGPAAGVASVSCGPDCTLASWIYSPDAGAPTVAYAFLTPQGCGTGQSFGFQPAFGESVPLQNEATAVAAQPGSVAIAGTAWAQLPPNCGGGLTCVPTAVVYVQICTAP